MGHTAELTVVWSKRRGIVRATRGDLNPSAINSRGWVSGSYDQDEHAIAPFVWLRDGVIITLPSPPALFPSSYAVDLNNRGQIAGTAVIIE